MGSFWEEIEKENNRKREENYIDDPNIIRWMSLVGGFMMFIMMFVFCPMVDKKSGEYFNDLERKCQDNFYKNEIYAVVKGKEFKSHTYYLTLHLIGTKAEETQIIESNCSRLHSIYNAVEIGDTILKPMDSLLVKIFHSPKYEELNRYETYRKK